MINVKLYGLLRVESGVRELWVDADSLKTLYPLVWAELQRLAPAADISEAKLRGSIAAVNGKQVRPSGKLHDGDVVMLIPPGAGG